MLGDRAFLLAHLVAAIPPNDRAFLDILDDYAGPDQRLDVPIGWNRRPYRFFFGDVERPIAFMNKFMQDFVPLDEIFRARCGFSPSALLNFSLLHQDILIDNLISLTYDVGTDPSDSLEAPAQYFPDSWWQALRESWEVAYSQLSSDDCLEVDVWLEGRIKWHKQSGQVQLEIDQIANEFPLAWERGRWFAPFPQLWLGHLVALFSQEAKSLASEEPTIGKTLSETTQARAVNALALLASGTPDARLFENVRIRLGDELSSEVHAVLVVDVDKLILVQIATAIEPELLHAQIERASLALSSACQLIEKIAERQQLSLVARDGREVQPPGFLTHFTSFPMILINQVTLDPIVISLARSPFHTQALMLTDIEAMTGEIEDALDFIRFLRAIRQLRVSGVQLGYSDFLDTWAWYTDNGHNFIWSARSRPNYVMIVSHWYSDKEMRELSAKAPIRRLLITQGILERCRFLGDDKNILRVWDPLSRVGVMIRTSDQRPKITMIHICSPESDSQDVRTNESLAELLLRRQEDAREVITALLEHAPANARDRLVIWLYGERTLRSSPVLAHLLVHLDTNPNDPVVCRGTVPDQQEMTCVALLYRDSLLELMGLGAVEGELLLMKALVSGIAFAVNASQELVASSIQAIHISGPKGINVESIETGHAWIKPSRPRPISPAEFARTTVEVAKMLAEAGVQPGEYQDQQARDLINLRLFPFLRDRLDSELRTLQPVHVLRWVYQQVENACAHYQIERLRLGSVASALDIEFDLGEAASRLETEDLRILQAGSLILERLAMVRSSGEGYINREIGERLLAYASILLELSQASEQDYHCLRRITLAVSNDYAVNLSLAEGGALELGAWRSAAAAQDFSQERPIKRPLIEDGKHQRLTQSLPELQAIDREFRSHFGYGLDDLLEVLLGLSRYALQPGDEFFPLAVGEPDELLQHLASVVRDFREEEAKKVVPDLFLLPQLLSEEEWRPWLLRGRRHRFATRPLFPLDNGKCLFGPWKVEYTLKSWLAYLFEGMLPIPDSTLSSGLKDSLQRFRDQKNRQLEDEIAMQVDKLHLPRIGPRIVRPEKRWGSAKGSPVGEIDLLVAETNTRTMYVLEVKDPARALVIDDIAEQIRDFYEGENSFQATLERKGSFIRNHIHAVLGDLRITDREGWQVREVFVTRFPLAAAYAKAQKHPFLTLHNLDKLKNPGTLI